MSTLEWSVEPRKRAAATTFRSIVAGRLPLALILLVGVAVRVILPSVHHAWSGTLEVDDGVHLGAAELLMAGHLPYRDFAFLQPPGIVLLLQPLAALARLIGDDRALVVGRLAFVAIGVLNICLVWKLLRARGRVAAMIAAAFYAAWWGTAVTERTLLLEPLLNLGLLLTLLLLRRGSSRAVALAGLALGLTCTIKLWPLVFLPVFAVWVARAQSARAARRFVLGAVASFGAVIAPFLILAGRALPHDVLFSQLGRHDHTASMLGRLQAFDGLGGIGSLQHAIPAWLVALAAVLFIALAVRLARRDHELGLWLALLIVGTLALLLAPSFYYHYPAFVGVPLAATLASIGSEAWGRLRRNLKPVAALGGVLVASLLAVSAARGGWSPQPIRHDIAAMSRARCVWADVPILLITESHFADQSRCGFVLDPSSLVMAAGRAQAGRTFRAEFARAQVALLWGAPRRQWGWNNRTVQSFRWHFRFAGHLSRGVSLWTARARQPLSSS
jgi:alpha-1,2-mannosyltransferase